MVKSRIIDNRNRPAQPEPGEDLAVKRAPVRKGALKRKPAAKKAAKKK